MTTIRYVETPVYFNTLQPTDYGYLYTRKIKQVIEDKRLPENLAAAVSYD